METKTCLDKNCPIHGQISVRGKTLVGTILKMKSSKTAVIQMEKTKFIQKYERYVKKSIKLSVHAPECLDLLVGDVVEVGETRKLSKTKSFVIIKKVGHVTEEELENKYEGIETGEDNETN